MEFNKQIIEKYKYVRKNCGTKKGRLLSHEQIFKKYPDIKQYFDNLLIQYPAFYDIKNLLWCINNNFDIETYKCKTCGKQLILKNIKYLKSHCNQKCVSKDTDIVNEETTAKRLEASKQACIKKFGVDTTFKLPEVQEKCKKTIIKKYGEGYNPFQLTFVKEKIKETNLKKYGVENPAQSPEIQEKIQNTCLQKYGVKNVRQLEKANQKLFDKSWNTILTKFTPYVSPMFNRDNWYGLHYKNEPKYKWKCVKCQQIFEQNIYVTGIIKRYSILQYIPRCPHCYPPNPNRSALEINVYNYICEVYKEFYPNADIEKEVLHNQYNIIPPKELDIYIPSLHLAFEVDGTYWHSEKFHDAAYHEDKDKRCLNLGINLYHIKEEDWEENIFAVQLEIKKVIMKYL